MSLSMLLKRVWNIFHFLWTWDIFNILCSTPLSSIPSAVIPDHSVMDVGQRYRKVEFVLIQNRSFGHINHVGPVRQCQRAAEWEDTKCILIGLLFSTIIRVTSIKVRQSIMR